MNKAIYFDIGGVLIKDHLGPKTALPTFQNIAPIFNFDPLWATKTFQNIQEAIDLGEKSPKDLADLLQVDEKKLTDSLWPKDPFIEERLELVRLAKAKGYKVGLATNFNNEWLELVIQKNKNFPKFDAVACSSLIKFVKPSEKFYQEAERIIGTSDILFIDDKQKNLDAAKKIGWKIILAENTWYKDFQKNYLGENNER